MGVIAMDATRRALLGAAALGAGGLALTRAAAAAEGNDHGKPGEGGYARNAVQLPTGAKVAYHDPKDIEAMPNFKYSLDGNDPKITSGGWAKESTVHQLPTSKGIAGVHMFLNPGASRELHWHAIAAEWGLALDADSANGTQECACYFRRSYGVSIPATQAVRKQARLPAIRARSPSSASSA